MSDLVLDTLKITNFKTFYGTHIFELDRGPGLFYISGDNKLYPDMETNGVGKSTIWDALMWVLWGKTGRDNKPAAAVIPWGMDEGKTEVSLKFTKGGRPYRLTRTRNPNSLTLINGKMPDKVREITQDRVPDLIGMTEETFRRTMVIGQFQRLFLDMKPEEQSQMFSDACNLHVYLKAAKIASKEQSTLSDQLDEVKAKIQRIGGQIEEVSRQLKFEKGLSADFKKQKQKDITSLQAEIQLKEEKLAEFCKKAEIRPPRRPSQRVKRLEAIKARYDRERASQEAWGGERRGLERSKDELLARNAHILKLTAEYTDILSNVYTERTCPECGQEVSKSHLKDKLDEMGADSAGIHVKLKACDKQLAILNDRIAGIDTAQAELASIYEWASKHTEELKILEKQLEKTEASENPYGPSLTHHKNRRDVMYSELQALEVAERNIEESIEVAKYWAGAFKEIRLNIIDSLLSELETTVTDNVEALGLKDWRIEFKTDRVTKSGDVSLGFTVLLYPPDQDEPIKWESYSGGEVQRWQLAVAFGLSEVLLGRAGVTPNIEVIDEPTKWVSETGVDNLLECLHSRSRELERAIYFVDHHSMDSGSFDGTIRVTLTEKGSSIKDV